MQQQLQHQVSWVQPLQPMQAPRLPRLLLPMHAAAAPATSPGLLLGSPSRAPGAASPGQQGLAGALPAAGAAWQQLPPSSSGSNQQLKDSRLVEVLQSQLELQRRLQETMMEQGRLRVRPGFMTSLLPASCPAGLGLPEW
jgi:hypothetical protein